VVGILTLLDLVSSGLPLRHRSGQILPDEAEVIHDRTDCAALGVGSAEEDEDAGKLDHLQPLICHGNATQRSPELLLRGNIADVKMDVSRADSGCVRCGELPRGGHRESRSQSENKRDRGLHGGDSTRNCEQKEGQ
jgi:hypothetical protein